MVNYQNTVIYKLCSKDPNIQEIYIGYTTNIKNRIRVHREVCLYPIHKSHNQCTYRYIRENGGWNNWTYEILEEYPCNEKKKALEREKMWFDRLKPMLNTKK
jgi:hypothetical protein